MIVVDASVLAAALVDDTREGAHARETIAGEGEGLRALSRALATVDVLASFADQAARIKLISQPAAQPGAQRDAREHRADDAGGGLQRDPQVRRQQPHGQDLQHQHRS